MFIKILRTFFITFFSIIIFIIFNVIYLYKNILNETTLKYNLINTLKCKYGINSNFKKIRYLKPDLFIIEDALLNSSSFIIKAQKIVINTNLTQSLMSKKLNLKPDSIKIESMSFKYITSQQTDKNRVFETLKEIKNMCGKFEVLSSYIDIPSRNIKISINRMFISNSFFSNNIDLFFDGDYYHVSKKFGIRTLCEIDDKEIKLKELTTNINGKDIELNGNIGLNENFKGSIDLKIKDPIDIKEIANIPHSIIIEPFKAKIVSEVKNHTFIFSSSIKSLNTELDMKFDIEKKIFTQIYIKAKDLDKRLFKEYIEAYVNNFDGKINLTAEIKPPSHKYSIIAESPKFEFTDLLNAINFNNTTGKLMITDSFYAVNLTKINGSFPYGSIRGNIKMEGTLNTHKININSTLDLNKLDTSLIIKNANNSHLRFYDLSIKTQNFSLKKTLNIIEYFKEKALKHHSPSDSIYNFINKKMNIHIESEGYSDEPYITANKLISSIKYSKVNDILNCEGEFKIKLLNGQIKNISENARQNQTYRLIFLPLTQIYTLNRTGALRLNYELKNINFHDVGSSFKLNNGKIIVDKFYLNSVEFLIYSKGEIDLNTKKLNMSVYIINRKDYKEGALPEFLTDSKGRPAIAFTIKGDFDKNEVKMMDATNITKLVEDEVKSSIDIN